MEHESEEIIGILNFMYVRSKMYCDVSSWVDSKQLMLGMLQSLFQIWSNQAKKSFFARAVVKLADSTAAFALPVIVRVLEHLKGQEEEDLIEYFIPNCNG